MKKPDLHNPYGYKVKTPAVPSVSEPEDIPDDEDEEPTEEEKQEILAELEEEEREAEKKTAPEPAGSPLWQNYTALQNKYPGHILAYRVGDFYEVFGDNAKLLAEPLNLTLTSRDCTGWTATTYIDEDGVVHNLDEETDDERYRIIES